MSKSIDISSLWEAQADRLMLDVRSPGEFHKGHIPNTVNLPLFSNDERAEVGTIYKQVNPEEALIRGLEVVGPKMGELVRQAKRICPTRKVIVHCWRGGKRSFSLAWLLGIAGFDVLILKGGYKAYRNFIHKEFEERKLNMLVLGGKTGCGKTEILKEIEKHGEQLIDLEGLAHHKGSAFGSIGEEDQPTVEQFENNLYEVFRKVNADQRVWVENESKSIGRVYIPEGFWKQFKAAPLINIELPFERRLDFLVESYGACNYEELAQAFQKIKKRLGGQHLKAAIEALSNNDLKTAAGIALKYYDKSYQYMLDNNNSPDIQLLSFENEPNSLIAKHLVKLEPHATRENV